MGFHDRRSDIKNRAEKEHSHSHPGWIMTRGQRSKTELRKSTPTHMLDGRRSEIKNRAEKEHSHSHAGWQEVRDQKQS
jgi:hypothetical protein